VAVFSLWLTTLRSRFSSFSASQSTTFSLPMYIGLATSQKSPVCATHPDSSPTFKIVATKSLDFIFDLLCAVRRVKPVCFGVSLR